MLPLVSRVLIESLLLAISSQRGVHSLLEPVILSVVVGRYNSAALGGINTNPREFPCAKWLQI